MTDKELVAKIIKRKRGDRTMAAFGEIYGVGRDVVNNWEKARYMPSAGILRKMRIERVYQVQDEETNMFRWHYSDGSEMFQTSKIPGNGGDLRWHVPDVQD